jgi:signal transduction histidine kinase
MVATETGRFVDEGWRIRKGGSRYWAGVTITALRDEDGRLRGFAKLTRDLSERKRTEALEESEAEREQLLEAERSARISAQRTARMKDEFLATLSHELRTPLSAILGWSEILKRQGTPKPEDLQRAVEAIERNARAQAHLIEDLLDLSRILSGRLRLDVQQIPVIDIVRAAIDSAEPTAHTKGIRLESALDPRGGMVAGDSSRLQQVFWNLLSNAIKFTPKGGRVQVLLQRVDSHIELSVSDTGIGIPASFLPHVFERFSQKDASTTRKFGGLGLGLAIAKQLVELHGGSLQAKSLGEGKGATFVVTLPLTIVEFKERTSGRTHPAQGSSNDESALPQLTGVRVLVVDDEPTPSKSSGACWKEQGAIVSLAASAEEALNVLEAAQPDVIVSDIGMPGVDGFQFMRRLREREAKGERGTRARAHCIRPPGGIGSEPSYPLPDSSGQALRHVGARDRHRRAGRQDVSRFWDHPEDASFAVLLKPDEDDVSVHPDRGPTSKQTLSAGGPKEERGQYGRDALASQANRLKGHAMDRTTTLGGQTSDAAALNPSNQTNPKVESAAQTAHSQRRQRCRHGHGAGRPPEWIGTSRSQQRSGRRRLGGGMGIGHPGTGEAGPGPTHGSRVHVDSCASHFHRRRSADRRLLARPNCAFVTRFQTKSPALEKRGIS